MTDPITKGRIYTFLKRFLTVLKTPIKAVFGRVDGCGLPVVGISQVGLLYIRGREHQKTRNVKTKAYYIIFDLFLPQLKMTLVCQ